MRDSSIPSSLWYQLELVGYTNSDYMLWPVVTHIFLFLLMIVGACAGSTSGGLKLMRVKLGLKIAWREIGRIVQPSALYKSA